MIKITGAVIDNIPEGFYEKEARVRAKYIVKSIERAAEEAGRPEFRNILLAKLVAEEEKRLGLKNIERE